jgi:hypothetical protein
MRPIDPVMITATMMRPIIAGMVTMVKAIPKPDHRHHHDLHPVTPYHAQAGANTGQHLLPL